jgi:NADH dehydrogenase
MSEKSSAQSRQYLEKLGVTIMTNTLIKDYDGQTAVMQDGKTIESAMVIWAAGVKGNVPTGLDKNLIAKGNRIKTDRLCKVIGSENLFAIGDVAYMEEPSYPNGHPQVASVAIQQADMLFDNLTKKSILTGKKPLLEFKYKDKGSTASWVQTLWTICASRQNVLGLS